MKYHTLKIILELLSYENFVYLFTTVRKELYLVLHCKISTVPSNGWTGSSASGGVAALKWSVL